VARGWELDLNQMASAVTVDRPCER